MTDLRITRYAVIVALALVCAAGPHAYGENDTDGASALTKEEFSKFLDEYRKFQSDHAKMKAENTQLKKEIADFKNDLATIKPVKATSIGR